MYPPGRVIFIRPLKQLVGQRHRGGPRRLEKGWDAVWVTPKELIAEGILISGKVQYSAHTPELKNVEEKTLKNLSRRTGTPPRSHQEAFPGGHTQLRQGDVHSATAVGGLCAK